MKDLLVFLSKSLVKHPDEVDIQEKVLEDGTLEFSLRVNPEDMGRIIGRNGKTARAIRLLVSAKGSMENKRTVVEIKED
jgi:predicted RNA-binding protein YlqC (UPF0109 family)